MSDEDVLRMLAGAKFEGSARLILPSGKELDAAEAAQWIALENDGE